jgi:hypothetical protein
VRVKKYRLEGVVGAEPIYRLLTTILDPDKAPAKELAALYHERWEIETALDELKKALPFYRDSRGPCDDNQGLGIPRGPTLLRGRLSQKQHFKMY